MPPKNKKPLDIMQRRIPTNPKYKHVQSSIDTGASLSRYQRKVEELRENYRFRNDELFKRMKISTFVQLILQVEEINLRAQMESEEEIRLHAAGYYKRSDSSDEDNDGGSTLNGDDFDDFDRQSEAIETLRENRANNKNVNNSRPDITERSTLQSVISGMGEIDMNRPTGGDQRTAALPNTQPFPDNLPYLLLDVRDRDEYDQFRIIKAFSYPHTMLSRSVNFETKEMLACRNQPGKIVVVYDEDERIAPKVATILFQRGYDNLFMLSGGLKVAMKKFPLGLVCGSVPKHLIVTPASSAIGSTAQSRTSTARSKMSVAPSNSASNRDVSNRNIGKLGASGDMSVGIGHSPLREEFTTEDLEELALQLDVVLSDNASSTTTSSRQQSTRASGRTMSSAASLKSSLSDAKKPFK